VSAFDERLMDGMSWRRLHFREGLLPASGFFREESVPYSFIFATDSNPATGVVAAFESIGLAQARLDPVWNSIDGAIPVDPPTF
jgi:hypothetical protein